MWWINMCRDSCSLWDSFCVLNVRRCPDRRDFGDRLSKVSLSSPLKLLICSFKTVRPDRSVPFSISYTSSPDPEKVLARNVSIRWKNNATPDGLLRNESSLQWSERLWRVGVTSCKAMVLHSGYLGSPSAEASGPSGGTRKYKLLFQDDHKSTPEK